MTNREKLEALRAGLADKMKDPVPSGTMVLFQVLMELIGLLLGADGPRSPLADAERADKLTTARGAVKHARDALEDWRMDATDAERLRGMRSAAHHALDAIAAITHVLAAEPATRREPAAELQPGDVVRLRSGGPAMTVLGTVKKGDEADMPVGWVQCGIMRSDDPVGHYTGYPPAALVRVADEQKPAQRERDRRSILVDAERAINDLRAELEGHPLGTIPPELFGRLMDVRDRSSGALAEDDA